jgi:phosphoglycolate phosphatase-like HAD superfamily hydrolase
MIGDSDIDIRSGNAAGVITCGLTYGIGRKGDIEKAKPDYIFDDIRKVKDIIY